MSTDAIVHADQPLTTLPPEMRPCVENLVTEDDTSMDNLFSEKQQRFLTEPLYASWSGPGEGRPFLAMANVGVFFAIDQPPFVPDMLLSLDVQCPADLWPKRHRSYFVWEYGKPPDVIVEIVSNRKGGEDSEKLVGYSRIRIPYYAIFDPDHLLSDRDLRVYELQRLDYRLLDEPTALPAIGLGLTLWKGSYESHDNTWLRWIDTSGQLIATGAERAKRAEQRAKRAEQRADRLAEQLRQLGVEPEA